MPISARAVTRGLLRKGFRLTESRHRRFRYYNMNGERTRVVTLTSHGSERDLDDRLLAKMARQLRLTRRQFDDLIDCRLAQGDYEAMLRRDGLVR
jgi:predicted RNA binding protein YcfA (HicA-like mRNA interferase family)